MNTKEITVLMVEPGKHPKVTKLKDDLDSLQKAVSIGADYQGLIEFVSLGNGDQFRAVLLDDTGEVFSQEFTAGETVYYAVDAQADKRFYRVEIYNVATDTLVGIGNPIWNQ